LVAKLVIGVPGEELRGGHADGRAGQGGHGLQSSMGAGFASTKSPGVSWVVCSMLSPGDGRSGRLGAG
jgi:hypothetical protein